jgi:hypothetical protein
MANQNTFAVPCDGEKHVDIEEKQKAVALLKLLIPTNLPHELNKLCTFKDILSSVVPKLACISGSPR